MQRISEVAYEDDIKDLPSVPDVGNYLVSEVILEDRLKCFLWFYVDSPSANLSSTLQNAFFILIYALIAYVYYS